MKNLQRPRRSSGIWSLRSAAAVILAASFGVVGCGDTADQADKDSTSAKEAAAASTTDERRRRFGNLREGPATASFDLNKDGEPDQFEFTSGGTVSRYERDMNFDGRTDVWQYPDDQGNIVEEEMDLDLDGNVDVIVFYKDGVVSRKDMSVNFDNKFTIAKFYNKKGKLLRVERDEDGDGQVDQWQYYNDKGERERVGWDDNGDGSPDTFDHLP